MHPRQLPRVELKVSKGRTETLFWFGYTCLRHCNCNTIETWYQEHAVFSLVINLLPIILSQSFWATHLIIRMTGFGNGTIIWGAWELEMDIMTESNWSQGSRHSVFVSSPYKFRSFAMNLFLVFFFQCFARPFQFIALLFGFLRRRRYSRIVHLTSLPLPQSWKAMWSKRASKWENEHLRLN